MRIEEKQGPVSTVEYSEISQFLRADMVADSKTIATVRGNVVVYG